MELMPGVDVTEIMLRARAATRKRARTWASCTATRIWLISAIAPTARWWAK